MCELLNDKYKKIVCDSIDYCLDKEVTAETNNGEIINGGAGNDTILSNDVCIITYSIMIPKNKQQYKKGYVYTKDFRIPFTYKSSVIFGEYEDKIGRAHV